VTSPTDNPSKLKLDLRAADTTADRWRSLVEGRSIPGALPVFLWETPEGESLVACGSATQFQAGGPPRFSASRKWFAGNAGIRIDRDGSPQSIGLAVAGFSFAETAATGWAASDGIAFAPERILRIDRDRKAVETRQEPVLSGGREADRPGFDAAAGPAVPVEDTVPARPEWSEAAWERAVRAALEEIEAGRLEKVVLARCREIEVPRAWNLLTVYKAMRETYPSSFRFLLTDGRGSAFLGASPERLVSLRGGRVEAEAVAGTARAAIPADRDPEGARAASLLADPKERREHEVVLREVLSALTPCCSGVAAEPEPSVQTHRHLLHLRTRVTADAEPGTHVLDLVSRLHPTPAVAGLPRAAALEFIREWEPRERGWYAGPIGWFDSGGNGDFTVGLRSALVRGNRALLFGGAGIVAGSDPAREWGECEAKMESMLDALAHG